MGLSVETLGAKIVQTQEEEEKTEVKAQVLQMEEIMDAKPVGEIAELEAESSPFEVVDAKEEA